MIDIAIRAAQSTPYGGAAHLAASAICSIRGLDPNLPANSQLGPVPLFNWQVVIVEETLRAMLRRELAI